MTPRRGGSEAVGRGDDRRVGVVEQPGDVAVLGVEPTEAVEQGARRAPDAGGGALLDGLPALRGVEHRLAVLVDHADRLEHAGRHGAAEVGADDRAGVQGEGPDAVGPPPLVSGEGEQHVGRLRLAVAGDGVVGPVVVVGVVEHDVGGAVGPRRDDDDPRPVGPAQRRPEAGGQLEVPEVVGGEVGLVAALVPAERGTPDAGALDEQVQRSTRPLEAVGEGIDRGRAQEVHRFDLDAVDPGQDRRRPLDVAGRHDHGGAGRPERSHGLDADPRRPTGDDGDPVRQVDAVDDVVGGGGDPEARAER